MRTIIYLSFICLMGCAEVQFQPLALYDVYEEHPVKEISSATIFDEGTGTMWNSLFECGNFEITQDEAYKGNSSIKISWNKSDCEWIGFGNSWNNWVPTDLSKDRYNLALSLYARTQEKTANSIPIVAALEDFGGGGSYYFIDANKYLRGLQLDSTWKQIVVPLWHFPIFEDEVDITSIKQMQFQLEGAGSFYLDQIEVIPYSEEAYAIHRDEVELMRPKGQPNQIIYTEGEFYNDAWGYKSNPCQELKEIKEPDGNTCIEWKYSSKDCNWAKWGINWNNWYASNIRGLIDQSAISFRIKVSENAKFKIVLEDFQWHKSEILTETQIEQKEIWQRVNIPLSNLNLIEKGFNLDQIKQLSFEGLDSGTISIDDIQIIQLDSI